MGDQLEETQQTKESKELPSLTVPWWIGATNKITLSLQDKPFSIEFPADANVDQLLLLSMALQDIAHDIRKQQEEKTEESDDTFGSLKAD